MKYFAYAKCEIFDKVECEILTLQVNVKYFACGKM